MENDAQHKNTDELFSSIPAKTSGAGQLQGKTGK
jgi:hypothetical protein